MNGSFEIESNGIKIKAGKYLKSITLKSGMPEQMFAYSSEAVDEVVVTGYVGEVLDTFEFEEQIFLLINVFDYSKFSFKEVWYLTDELLYDLNEEDC